MMTAVLKAKGFEYTQQFGPRSYQKPYSDDPMTFQTDFLTSQASTQDSNPTIISRSPFPMAQSLPNPSMMFMTSPPSTSGIPTTYAPPSTFFGEFQFSPTQGGPGPPMSLSPQNMIGRVKVESDSPPNRPMMMSMSGKMCTKPTSIRKMSLNEARPNSSKGRGPQYSDRPATMHGQSIPHGHGHARAGSQNDVFGPGQVLPPPPSEGIKTGLGLGLGLETHVEGGGSSSVTPPDYSNYNYGLPRGVASWSGQSNSTTGQPLMANNFGSFDGQMDQTSLDSPVTPARRTTALPGTDESYKKQRRRECHNQVEKRRREHINAKIEELSRLLPSHYNQQDESVVAEEEEEDSTSSGKKKKKRAQSQVNKSPKDAVQCKGRVLSQSVQYIYDLRHLNDMQAARIQQMESMFVPLSASQASQTPMAMAQSPTVFWPQQPPTGSGPTSNTFPSASAVAHPRRDNGLGLITSPVNPIANVDHTPMHIQRHVAQMPFAFSQRHHTFPTLAAHNGVGNASGNSTDQLNGEQEHQLEVMRPSPEPDMQDDVEVQDDELFPMSWQEGPALNGIMPNHNHKTPSDQSTRRASSGGSSDSQDPSGTSSYSPGDNVRFSPNQGHGHAQQEGDLDDSEDSSSPLRSSTSPDAAASVAITHSSQRARFGAGINGHRGAFHVKQEQVEDDSMSGSMNNMASAGLGLQLEMDDPIAVGMDIDSTMRW